LYPDSEYSSYKLNTVVSKLPHLENVSIWSGKTFHTQTYSDSEYNI